MSLHGIRFPHTIRSIGNGASSFLGTKNFVHQIKFFLGGLHTYSHAFAQTLHFTLLRVTLTPSSGYTRFLPTMLPRREASSEESNATTSTPVAYLALALQEMIQLQKQRPPLTIELDTHSQLPNFVDQMNAETVDSWIRSLSTYLKTSRKVEDAIKL